MRELVRGAVRGLFCLSLMTLMGCPVTLEGDQTVECFQGTGTISGYRIEGQLRRTGNSVSGELSPTSVSYTGNFTRYTINGRVAFLPN